MTGLVIKNWESNMQSETDGYSEDSVSSLTSREYIIGPPVDAWTKNSTKPCIILFILYIPMIKFNF